MVEGSLHNPTLVTEMKFPSDARDDWGFVSIKIEDGVGNYLTIYVNQKDGIEPLITLGLAAGQAADDLQAMINEVDDGT